MWYTNSLLPNMIPSFLFLLYLLSNTILLGLEASEGENGKVSTTRKNVLLSHLSYQLWIFHCGMSSFQLSALLACYQQGNHVHMCTNVERNMHPNSLALSCCLLNTYLHRICKCISQTLPLEVLRAFTVWGTPLACVSEEQNSWGMLTTSITLASGRH